jgi:hypothetical protein
MKRFWLGVCLLAVLLALGLMATVGVRNFCRPLKEQLRQAQKAALEEEWDRALGLQDQCRQRWQRRRKLCAAITDHGPMEEIDGLFRALEVFGQRRDAVRFAESCAQLGALTEAVEEAQAVKWWNVF